MDLLQVRDLVSLAPLSVTLPFLGAAIAFTLIRHRRAQQTITIVTLTVALIIETMILIASWDQGAASVALGGWLPPYGINLVVDRLSALMLVVSTVVSLAVLIYASGQGAADDSRDGPITIFHPTYLVLVAGVSNAFLAGDLFNLFVGFEILLTASYVLLTMGSTGPRVRAGVIYMVVSVISSALFLIAIGMIYSATGTVNFADLAVKLAELPEPTQMILHLLLVVAFGIKAAVFPLAFWLPDSYPTAPAPVTAVFAGLLTKVGVYALIRTETLLFPSDKFNDMLLIIASLTMVVGILGAIAQTDIKRMLSFTLISHIGYMIYGLGVANETAVAATVYYVAHHIVVQTGLFLVVGLIERRGGSANLERLGGLLKISPLLAALYFIPAMNLAGIPPFSGFLGKVGLLQGGIQIGSPLAWVGLAAMILTSVLTLLAVTRVWARAFWRRPEDALRPDALITTTDVKRIQFFNRSILHPVLVTPTIALIAVGVGLTVFASSLFNYSGQAARDIILRTPYIEAVLGDEHGGQGSVGVVKQP